MCIAPKLSRRVRYGTAPQLISLGKQTWCAFIVACVNHQEDIDNNVPPPLCRRFCFRFVHADGHPGKEKKRLHRWNRAGLLRFGTICE